MYKTTFIGNEYVSYSNLVRQSYKHYHSPNGYKVEVAANT